MYLSHLSLTHVLFVVPSFSTAPQPFKLTNWIWMGTKSENTNLERFCCAFKRTLEKTCLYTFSTRDDDHHVLFAVKSITKRALQLCFVQQWDMSKLYYVSTLCCKTKKFQAPKTPPAYAQLDSALTNYRHEQGPKNPTFNILIVVLYSNLPCHCNHPSYICCRLRTADRARIM